MIRVRSAGVGLVRGKRRPIGLQCQVGREAPGSGAARRALGAI